MEELEKSEGIESAEVAAAADDLASSEDDMETVVAELDVEDFDLDDDGGAQAAGQAGDGGYDFSGDAAGESSADSFGISPGDSADDRSGGAGPEGMDTERGDEDGFHFQTPAEPQGYVNKRGQTVSIRSYDFRRPIQLSKGFFRSLSMVGEAYSKLLTLSLSNYLHIPVSVTLKNVRQAVFEEHTKSIPNPSFINILSLAPIKVPAMMDMELNLALMMIEKLLGSHKLGTEMSREFTTIEMRIARKIVMRMLTDLREAMMRLLEVNVSLTSIEHNPDFTYIMNANDPCILMLFDIEVGEAIGKMSICISLAALDAELGTEGPAAFHDIRSAEERHSDSGKLSKIVDSTGSDLVVELGSVQMKVEELLDLQPGSIINLRKQVDEAMIVKMGGCPIFRGKMGRYKIKSALRITEILWPKHQRFIGAMGDQSTS